MVDGGEGEPQRVGAHALRAGAVGKELELLLPIPDRGPVFHLAADGAAFKARAPPCVDPDHEIEAVRRYTLSSKAGSPVLAQAIDRTTLMPEGAALLQSPGEISGPGVGGYDVESR